MPTSTSLNLQALLKTASVRTGMDESASRVRGLSPAAQALYVAVQASHRKNALCVVVVPTDEDVERFACDLRFFAGALESASDTALETIIKPFPSLQIDPYRKLAPHFHVASARAAALHGLATGTARVVIASGLALLPKLSRPDRFRST
jgi:transcription-repair coupling factor (superfamily II helicase)